MPLADFYSLSYLWVSTVGFIVAVVFGLIGSFVLGELTNPAFYRAFYGNYLARLNLFGYILKCVFKASTVKDMVNKLNWHGRVEFQTMKTNHIQPTVRAGS